MRVVADDLSGAVETAAVLGLARVRLAGGPREHTVLDLDTRSLPAHEAAARVRRAGRIDFKKIDSQLRGNVAAELAALEGEVIVAPALPVEGRVVRGGVLYVNGERRTSPVRLTDAETDADLDAIVATADGATLVGSAGLAAALGRTLGARPLPPPHRSDARLFVLVGTRAAGEQLERLAATGVATIGPQQRPRGRVVAVRGRAQQLAAFAEGGAARRSRAHRRRHGTSGARRARRPRAAPAGAGPPRRGALRGRRPPGPDPAGQLRRAG